MVPQEPASSHGLAQWIMEDEETKYCCGPTDCLSAYSGEIIRTLEGWLHVPTNTVIAYDSVHVHMSKDIQIWRCVYAGIMRCIFLPTGV